MWNLDLNLGNFFLSASNYDFMLTLKVDESIFTGNFFQNASLWNRFQLYIDRLANYG